MDERRIRVKVAFVLGLALGAAAVALAFTLTEGSKTAAPDPTLDVALVVPVPPTVSPVRSTWVPEQQSTHYSVTVHSIHQGKPSYSWHLTLRNENPNCDEFGPVFGAPNRAVWHHADNEGCPHTGSQRLGTITVTVTTGYWKCSESFFGTLTGVGVPAQACSRTD
jgi:hypothetical protein